MTFNCDLGKETLDYSFANEKEIFGSLLELLKAKSNHFSKTIDEQAFIYSKANEMGNSFKIYKFIEAEEKHEKTGKDVHSVIFLLALTDRKSKLPQNQNTREMKQFIKIAKRKIKITRRDTKRLNPLANGSKF
jgi:hypothetical protein